MEKKMLKLVDDDGLVSFSLLEDNGSGEPDFMWKGFVVKRELRQALCQILTTEEMRMVISSLAASPSGEARILIDPALLDKTIENGTIETDTE